MPFTLDETEIYLKSRGIVLTPYQLVLLYMAIGGVPFYLKQADPGLSAAQIIDKICFTKGGVLRNEFDNLFSSLFEHSDQHNQIIQILRQKRSGMNRTQILSQAKIRSGGTISQILEELEESGFITSYVPFGKKQTKISIE